MLKDNLNKESIAKMIDRDKVIKTWEAVLSCYTLDAPWDLIDDTITLLKEHEAVKPKKVKGYNPPMYTLYEYECEECKSPMMNKQPFCMGCGRSVKWNA